MKRDTMKKTDSRIKGARKARQHERPLELDRSWQDLEAQHDRIKFDWMSLAAQISFGDKPKGF